MADITPEIADTLDGLASGRRSVVEGILGVEPEGADESELDPRTQALVGLAALIALAAPESEFAAQVDLALGCGATVGEIVAVLVAVAPRAGTPRVIGAAPAIRRALMAAASSAAPGAFPSRDRHGQLRPAGLHDA